MSHFIESHDRVRRAQEHANAFRDSYVKFLHSKPYGVVHKIRDDRNGVIELVPLKSLEWNLPLILGEYFYQLRAALDGAMWKAYRLCGSAQHAAKICDRDVYFPICETTESLKNAAFKRMALPNNLGKWIDSVQPCNGVEAANKIANDLLLINKRAAADRHRQLHLVGAVVRSDAPLVTLSPPAVITYMEQVTADPLKGEYVISRFGFEGVTSETEINVDANFSLNVKIEEVTDDVEIVVKLTNLIATVQLVIEKFESAFI
jgi:hypothetical protein